MVIFPVAEGKNLYLSWESEGDRWTGHKSGRLEPDFFLDFPPEIRKASKLP